MRNKIIPITCCFLAALFSISSADYIKLRTGEGAKVKINDTTGCYVNYTRGQTDIAFKKSLVKYIVFNIDTIDYSTYQCNDSSAASGPGSKSLGNPKKDKLTKEISALPYSTLQTAKNYKFYLIEKPISSNIEEIHYDTIFENAKQFFLKKHLELLKIGQDSLSSILASGQRSNTIVIVPTNVEIGLKYRTEYKMTISKYGSTNVYDSTDNKYTEVNATIACIDLSSMSIVFKDIYRKKKDNSNFLQFTDADVRNKMNELDNSLVSKVYDGALKAILKELQKNDN